MEKNAEKRKFPRITTHIPVKYRKLGDSSEKKITSSITRNLSEGGVRFRAPEFVSRACRLILELDMPMFTKPVKAISKVAWIRKTVTGDDYDIGSRFLEISKSDRELVSAYVNSLAFYNSPANQGVAGFAENTDQPEKKV